MDNISISLVEEPVHTKGIIGRQSEYDRLLTTVIIRVALCGHY